MLKLTITTGTADDFFKRGKELARKLDKGEKAQPEMLITFEDPEDLLELITAARLGVFKAIKEEPGSIAEIARRLHRDRSAVKRDIDKLTAAGLLEVELRTFQGHGKKKWVKALADNFNLVATVG